MAVRCSSVLRSHIYLTIKIRICQFKTLRNGDKSQIETVLVISARTGSNAPADLRNLGRVT